MADKWTKEQYQAISARDTSLIVSAAAGSGKTSVLVERLIRQLSSSENKIPADRIIVVTFTNDAASEMKLRLNAALSKLLEQEPENEWLYEQQSLIQSANISTIHSFCFNLIRENIQSLDISSGFRIIDESEDKIILKKALDMVIEQYCSDNSEMMKRLTDFFCTKGTFQLENTILKIYNFVITIPFYQEWLEKQLDLYSENSDISQWKNIYMEFLKNNLENFIQEAEEAKALCMEIEADAAYELINLEAMAFDRINKIITDENIEWDKKMSEFPSVLFDRIKFPKLEKDSFEAEIAESVKKIRNTYKSKFNKLVTEALFSEQEIKDDKEFVRIIFSDIIEVINRLDETVSLMKNEINGISFSDAERLTIGLLAEKNESGSVVKTELAQKLSEYYRIIMIDEFQDANNSQDLIFKMLSNNGTAEKYGDNAFLVGDIKQSIYRFRLANPMIFLNTLLSSNEYTEDFQGENAYVKLNKNFRSSSDVVNFVNFIFGRIMSVKTGEIDYTDDEKLIQGAIFPEKDRTTEILLVNTTESNADEETESDDETEENEKEIINKEAFAVASKIKSMLNDKINVSHKGIERPCVPADFCILLRNRASGTLFSEALKSFGILAHTDEVEGYLKSREITVLLNFLKVIDNPLLDIPLTSVLMSPIFMLSAEEMAEIRLFSKGESVYKALCISIGEIEDSDLEGAVDTESSYYRKALYFYDTLKRLRYLASGYGLEKLIRTIYDSTDFLSVVQIYRDGEQKRANLQLLLEYAKNYEETQNGGLSGFLRYIASVSANGGDLKRAGTVSLNDDVVTVKTIHKSKGLEFPFVFLCRTSSSFNSIDQRNQVQMSFSDVIGFKIQDKKQLKSYMTLPFIAVREQNRMNSMSEEMRLLYVALTRAKEKLFITLDINEK
ncbi:MAG TPA: UvrD-helicase domain-containing protein, partial [Oscillospiraceae bacterium]|nr:UvrD-helicase domain-containing protein [Oscillospiraceae bacterium]